MVSVLSMEPPASVVADSCRVDEVEPGGMVPTAVTESPGATGPTALGVTPLGKTAKPKMAGLSLVLVAVNRTVHPTFNPDTVATSD